MSRRASTTARVRCATSACVRACRRWRETLLSGVLLVALDHAWAFGLGALTVVSPAFEPFTAQPVDTVGASGPAQGANPQAFARNVNPLWVNSEVQVTSDREISALGAQQARDELLGQAQAFESRRLQIAVAPAVTSDDEARRAMGAVTPAVPMAQRLPAEEELPRLQAEIERLNALLRQLQQERSGPSASAALAVSAPVAAAMLAPSTALSAAQSLEQGLLAQPWWWAVAVLLVGGLLVVALVRLLRARSSATRLPQTRFMETRFEDDPPSFAGSASGAAHGVGHGTTESPGLTVAQALAPFDASQEVDPVAEAEMYLGYGRDRQAVEILTEAMLTDPTRLDVQVKLLEIHTLRREPEAFLALAGQLRTQSQAKGAYWDQACALAGSMGLTLDPPEAPQRDGAAPAPAAEAAAKTSSLSPSEASALERKLALAQEFANVGDRQAARELIQEVLARGDGPLQARARHLWSRFG